MKEQNIEIQDFEDKKSQGGRRYTRFKTSDGWMSAFDKDVIDKLKENEGKFVSVEVAVDEEKGFKNIRAFHGVAKGERDLQDKAEEIDEGKIEVIKIRDEFPKSMKVSYAKDCFCAIVTRISQAKFDEMKKEDVTALMDLAIEVVKKAATSF